MRVYEGRWQYPSVAEQCYRLVARLCEDARTARPTLAFLRTPKDYVMQHCRTLPPLRACALPAPVRP
jgi:hypothetical protein